MEKYGGFQGWEVVGKLVGKVGKGCEKVEICTGKCGVGEFCTEFYYGNAQSFPSRFPQVFHIGGEMSDKWAGNCEKSGIETSHRFSP